MAATTWRGSIRCSIAFTLPSGRYWTTRQRWVTTTLGDGKGGRTRGSVPMVIEYVVCPHRMTCCFFHQPPSFLRPRLVGLASSPGALWAFSPLIFGSFSTDAIFFLVGVHPSPSSPRGSLLPLLSHRHPIRNHFDYHLTPYDRLITVFPSLRAREGRLQSTRSPLTAGYPLFEPQAPNGLNTSFFYQSEMPNTTRPDVDERQMRPMQLLPRITLVLEWRKSSSWCARTLEWVSHGADVGSRGRAEFGVVSLCFRYYRSLVTEAYLRHKLVASFGLRASLRAAEYVGASQRHGDRGEKAQSDEDQEKTVSEV